MKLPTNYDLAGTSYKTPHLAEASSEEAVWPTYLGLQQPARRRLNVLAILQAWVLPSCIFVSMMALMTFSVWRDHQVQCIFLQACALLIVGVFAAKAVAIYRRGCEGEEGAAQPTWFVFLAVACLVAWLSGLLLGSSNYAANLGPYRDLSDLGIARGVDPADLPGTRHLDASRIVFKDGTRVAEELSLGFKDGTTYCAAPVVGNGTAGAKLASLDYWAVGTDCCNPLPPATFWCGSADVSDPASHGGIRLIDDSAKASFLLAIQQAEAEYGYQAMHPILFTWTKDPIADVEAMHTAGISFLLVWSLRFAFLQAAMVVGFLFSVTPEVAKLWNRLRTRLSSGDSDVPALKTAYTLDTSRYGAAYGSVAEHARGWH